ncbi:uncharacterized protein LOC144943873 [Lampetra fluviatilis]
MGDSISLAGVGQKPRGGGFSELGDEALAEAAGERKAHERNHGANVPSARCPVHKCDGGITANPLGSHLTRWSSGNHLKCETTDAVSVNIFYISRAEANIAMETWSVGGGTAVRGPMHADVGPTSTPLGHPWHSPVASRSSSRPAPEGSAPGSGLRGPCPDCPARLPCPTGSGCPSLQGVPCPGERGSAWPCESCSRSRMDDLKRQVHDQTSPGHTSKVSSLVAEGRREGPRSQQRAEGAQADPEQRPCAGASDAATTAAALSSRCPSLPPSGAALHLGSGSIAASFFARRRLKATLNLRRLSAYGPPSLPQAEAEPGDGRARSLLRLRGQLSGSILS